VPWLVVALAYAIAALTILVRAVRTRWTLRRPPSPDTGISDPYLLACLAGVVESSISRESSGRNRAVGSAIASLRVAGSILVTPSGNTGATGPAPAGGSALVDAVYQAAARHVPRHALIYDPGIVAALAQIRGRLAEAHWLLSDRDKARWRRGGLACLAMFAIGVALLVGLIVVLVRTGGPTAPAPFLVILSTIVAMFFAVVRLTGVEPPQTARLGPSFIRDQQTLHANLRPPATPSWEVTGAQGAALAVALFGYAALAASDPVYTGRPRGQGR
jgi:uncharacterized protein (TIGR04222 family)